MAASKEEWGPLHRCKDPDVLKENRNSPDVTLVEGWVGSCICQTVSFLLSVRESLNFADLVSLDPFQYFCTLNYLMSYMYVTLVSSSVKIVSVKVYLGFDLICIKNMHNGKTVHFCMCVFFYFVLGAF